MTEAATPQQIRKLYAVVRNSGRDPREYVRKLRAEKGPFTKRGISMLIDEFDDMDRKKEEIGDALEETGDVKEKKEVGDTLKEDTDSLNKIDTLFCGCLAKASTTISRMLPEIEQQARMILEVAKTYFEEVKGAKRE